MNQVQDPVCGMMIDPDTAAASVNHESREVYFCSDECRRAFEADPEAYVAKEGMTAPKFGSAGSGGLEYEPGPERDDRR